MYRPILMLPKTKYEKVLDIIGCGVFVVSIMYTVVMWGKLPDQIPAHFNGAGEIDRWGSKFELFILPGIGVFLWVLMGLLEKAPHMHNYPSRLNENNVEAFYLNSRKLLNEVKNFCLILFSFISVIMIGIALGEVKTLGWWFVPIVIIGTVIPILKGLFAASRIK